MHCTIEDEQGEVKAWTVQTCIGSKICFSWGKSAKSVHRFIYQKSELQKPVFQRNEQQKYIFVYEIGRHNELQFIRKKISKKNYLFFLYFGLNIIQN